MNEASKEKVLYALTLLATLLTLQPFLASFGGYGFEVAGHRALFQTLYYVVSGSLGLSVYAFSLTFLSDKLFGFLLKVGTFLFSASLVLPLAFGATWCAILSERWLSGFSESAAKHLDALQIVSSIAVTVLGAVSSVYTTVILRRRDRQRAQKKIVGELSAILERIDRLAQEGQLGMALLESVRGFEAVSRQLLVARGVDAAEREPMQKLIADLSRLEVLPPAKIESLQAAIVIRNQLAHGSLQAVSAAELASHVAQVKELMVQILENLEDSSDARN